LAGISAFPRNPLPFRLAPASPPFFFTRLEPAIPSASRHAFFPQKWLLYLSSFCQDMRFFSVNVSFFTTPLAPQIMFPGRDPLLGCSLEYAALFLAPLPLGWRTRPKYSLPSQVAVLTKLRSSGNPPPPEFVPVCLNSSFFAPVATFRLCSTPAGFLGHSPWCCGVSR